MRSVGFGNYSAHSIKESARKAIEQKYLRDRVFSQKALLDRWFYFLFFTLHGAILWNILVGDKATDLSLAKRLKGRELKDARISDHAGAWITERLCEKYLPALELSEDALLKQIQVWEKTLSK